MRPYIIAIAGQYRTQKPGTSKLTWAEWIDQAVRFLSEDETFNETEFRQRCEKKIAL